MSSQSSSDAPTSVAALRAKFGDPAVDTQLRFLEQYATEIDDPSLWLNEAVRGGFKGVPIEKVRACPCGSDQIDMLMPFVYWNLLGVSRCRRCGLVMTSPRLTSDAVIHDFSVNYFQPDQADIAHWGRRRTPVFKEILRYLRHLAVRRVFDVGSGYGHLLSYLGKHGLTAAGCDISLVAVQWGREHLDVDIVRASIHDLAPPTQPYDCVVCLDALYYAPDPLRELSAMRNFVRPGGHLILRLRNGSAVSRRMRRRFSRRISSPLYPAQHLWSFTPRTIARLLDDTGWVPRVMEPASYSRTRFGFILDVWHEAMRVTSRVLPVAWMPGLSFNVVASRMN